MAIRQAAQRSDEGLYSTDSEAEKKTQNTPTQYERLHRSDRSIFRGELSGETWTGSCVEILTEGSATGRQTRTFEETGVCRDCIFGGFDAGEGDYVCRHH